MMRFIAVFALLGLTLGACNHTTGSMAMRDSEAPQAKRVAGQNGMASMYGKGDGFAGRKTANGERMNPSAMTAAHRSLPFGTLVEVTNLSTGRSVVVRINDRGPFTKGRVIDLSYAAARTIGFSGVAPVALNVISTPQRMASR